MDSPGTPTVSVVIAAYNAAATIGRAVRSALSEPEVAEVIVVDDCSTDDTVVLARRAGADDNRLIVCIQAENRGPAAARNAGIAKGRAPLVAVLDADDFVLPGRFAELIAEDDWDFIADNIVFLDPETAGDPPPLRRGAGRPAHYLDFVSFVEDNISRRGLKRGEVGFLKPLMRRAFLARHALAYDETMRLGEDYALYARALALGARYKVISACGYAAVERADSLSGVHRTEDLWRLYEADRALLAELELDAAGRVAVAHHARHVREKYEHRRFLDAKRAGGLAAALRASLARPEYAPAVATGILADKWDALRSSGRPASDRREPRYLFP